MKKKDFKNKDAKELKEVLNDKSKKLQDFRHEVIAGRAKNVKEGRELRRDIARILTELNNAKA